MSFARAVRLRRVLKEYEFSGRLSHPVTVPAGPDGRPGERLLLPSRNSWNSEISRDGARHDCQALVSRRGSRLVVVCLGRVSDRGDPWASAHHTIDAVSRMRTRRGVLPPEATTLVGLPAVRYALGRADGEVQHEWKFDYQGWLYAVGIVVRPGDDDGLALGQRVIDTWQWQSEVSTEAQAPVEKQTGVLNFTRTIAATPEVVWGALRTLEGQAAIRAPLVDAFVVPPRPGDLGERFAFVKEKDGCRRTSLIEILEETPLSRLVTWDPHSKDENFRVAYELQPLPLRRETNVKAAVYYTLSADQAASRRQRDAADLAIQATLHRLQQTAEATARTG